MGGLVIDGDMLVTQLSPHGDDLGDEFLEGHITSIKIFAEAYGRLRPSQGAA